MNIYGAGLSGLLAGCAFQAAHLHEAGPPDLQTHKAVLRFRSAAVADLTGIEFRKVRVHKGLWSQGAFRSPSIQLANFYSQKVLGRFADRSIWHLDAVDRYIAPEDFIAQLQARCAGRIYYDSPLTTACRTYPASLAPTQSRVRELSSNRPVQEERNHEPHGSHS
jgi:hypothetical protein